MSEATEPALTAAEAVSGARWFISAPAGMNLRQLMTELRRRGVSPYVLSDVAPLGASIMQSLQQAIDAADFVLVVLGAAESSQNVLFEAGMAVGRGKPVVVIADPAEAPPLDLTGLLTIRARPDDLPAISFALDQAEGRSARMSQFAPATGHALGSRVDQLLGQLSTNANLTERVALDLLTQALESSGAVAAQSPDEVGRRFDIGVWSDDLDAIAANPLLIELKRKLSPLAVEQVLGYLSLSPKVRVALLVFLEPATNSLLKNVPYPVLAISLGELLERMRTASFAEVVRDLRNRTVHGRV
jgi:hypothetical protein